MNSNLNTNSRILLTGAAGFIGSCMATFLNKNGFENLFLVDDFTKTKKDRNHHFCKCAAKIDRALLEDFLGTEASMDFVIHYGARTDTTEMDYSIHEKLNLEYSKMIWRYCSQQQIPLIYASSAATYGEGVLGYDDNEEIIPHLHPLNPYGVSKNEFDKWILLEMKSKNPVPPHWYGLKFFNVYGPNEYHKGRMASVIFHAFHQIQEKGKIILFKSHNPLYEDGGQKRDFIYVKDVLEVSYWLLNGTATSGIYNLGTGKANTFLELATAIFNALSLPPHIEFIDTPIDIREKYQYFTEANMQKLIAAGYPHSFYNVEAGVADYVKNYLLSGTSF
jgi:ADP-L-glycero-D-manno-heptose 6-epimerase